MVKVEVYAKEIPEEIRRAVRGLDSDYRTAIFVALFKHGELSFSELRKTLEIDKAMLNYHLRVLIESALVHHYYKHEFGTEKYSFYNVTPFGLNFVESISQFLRPQPYLIHLPEEGPTASQVMTSARLRDLPQDLKQHLFCRVLINEMEKRWPETTTGLSSTDDANIVFPYDDSRHRKWQSALSSTS